MASRKVGPVLVEILDAIDGIQNFTAGKTFAEFESSWLLRLATQRALEIISEATRHIPDELLGPHADIPWKRIRASATCCAMSTTAWRTTRCGSSSSTTWRR